MIYFFKYPNGYFTNPVITKTLNFEKIYKSLKLTVEDNAELVSIWIQVFIFHLGLELKGLTT